MDPEYPRISAHGKVKTGFWKFHQIVESLIEALEDVSPEYLTQEEIKEMILDIVTDEWNQAVEIQKSWPEVVEADILEQVFRDLETNYRMMTRMNMDCDLCPPFATPEEAGLVPAFDEQGFVVFSEFHTARMINGGPLHLHFGSFAGTEMATLEVGSIVMRELIDAGFSVSWSGLAQESIMIEDIQWRKRLPVDEDGDGQTNEVQS